MTHQTTKVLSDREFDVILLDLWLGSENGFDLLRRLRQTRNTPSRKPSTN